MTQQQSTQTSRSAAYYKLLGLTPTASEAEVRQAYRQQSKLYHPDTTELPPEQAAEKFQQLKDAYAAITNTYGNPGNRHQATMSQPMSRPPRPVVPTANLDPKQRPLSTGEMFALFLLGITFVGCLVLALIVGTAQSEDLRTAPHPPQWAHSLVLWFHEHSPEISKVNDLPLSTSHLTPPPSTGLPR
ncbi:MAG: J domain-containing protein [Thermosynechococcaceae cyanobacterium]